MNAVIDKFVEVLSMRPEPVLSSGNLGTRQPSGGSDIPAVVISLSLESSSGNGIGRFIRAGDTVVKNTAVIEVRSTPETFFRNLKSLRLWPLPLKKNPASVEKAFTEKDLQIRNVTEPIQPIEYRMTEKPTQKEEYKLDLPRAQIMFGQAQTEREKLEVVHWTVTWRDEILGDRYGGSMILEIWANNFNEADGISRRLQDKLKLSRSVLRQKGFLKLQPFSLGSVENVSHDPPTGSPFFVWKQKLSYKFVFEFEEGGELSSGIPIKRIDAGINGHLNESLSIPSLTNET